MLKTLVRSFIENSDRNAFCIDDCFYTYKDLQCQVISIREQIEMQIGKTTGRNIAILCTDDFRTYASLFAIWFSGCAYVPLGLHNPVERNLSILNSADIDIIISSVELNNETYSSFKVINPEKVMSVPDVTISIPDINELTIAYVLFTSGSTGHPKGVPISHKNIASFVNAFSKSPFIIQKEDRCLQMFELTFDVSISSFLMPILKGACIYTTPDDGIKYVNVLKILQHYELTCIQIVPSIVKLARPLLRRLNFPHVRSCILTGEATQIDLIPEWENCIPNAEIFNYYGPTESTIYCSFYKYFPQNVKNYNGMLAIGKAFKDMLLLIVDDNSQEVAPDIKGELLIGGPQVTSGYLQNEEKNTEAFVIKEVKGLMQRFYRSGDMCYYDKSGDIFYCGRFDNQVKIQGFRIELSEIEFLVRSEFDINNVVIVSEDKQGATKLVLVLERIADDSISPVMEYLKRRLPHYMVPSSVRILHEFPLNVSGKTDRKRIKDILYADN